MNKLLNRKESGSSLLVLLLISLSLYFSYTQISLHQFPSSNKILKQSANLSLTLYDSYDQTAEPRDLEVEDVIQLSFFPTQDSLSSFFISLYNCNTFALFKVPLLFMLFDIPPPIL